MQVAAVVVLVVFLHVPLGDYMARVYADTRHWRVEKLFYRLMGAQPDEGQRCPGTTLIIVGLEYLYALALGPAADAVL